MKAELRFTHSPLLRGHFTITEIQDERPTYGGEVDLTNCVGDAMGFIIDSPRGTRFKVTIEEDSHENQS